MATQDALRKAREDGLDLVEINPKAAPPVCKILDYGKYKYEEKKKAAETKRKQATVEVKEVKLRPKTDDHDLEFKARAARRFLEDGNKVKFTVRFRGREIAHPQKAREQLVWIVEQVRDISNVEAHPAMEGRTMTMMVAPKPQILQALSAARAQNEKERKEALDARRGDDARKSSSGLKEPAESSEGKAESSEGKAEGSDGVDEAQA